MLTKTYPGYEDKSFSFNITCPTPEWESFVLAQNKDFDIFQCGLSQLEQFQAQPKFFPGHQISDYCLYLGTYTERYGPFAQKFHRYDLYAHRDWDRKDYYGTGIVFGNDPSNYCSGWPMSLISKKFELYNELFWREYACNLITTEIKSRFFDESFRRILDHKIHKWIRL